MSARILVTGATGFVGPRLLQALRQGAFSAAELLVWDYQPDQPSSLTNVNLCVSAEVVASVAAFKPTHVIHLAAQSHVPTSFAKPELTWNVNVMGSLHLFEALKQHCPSALTVFVSSSEVYGRSFASGVPADERTVLQPMNPYAASKAAADMMAGQYAELGMKILRLRPFNHIGPGQREEFVASAFAAQIARIEAGLQRPVIRVWNRDSRRDFLDVADVVQGYVAALEHGTTLAPGEVINLCRGETWQISTLLRQLLDLSCVAIAIEQDPKRMRPSDIPIAQGSAAKARQLLGWTPAIALEQTLKNVLDDWRDKVRSDAKDVTPCR